jgi:hypothetical protein
MDFIRVTNSIASSVLLMLPQELSHHLRTIWEVTLALGLESTLLYLERFHLFNTLS